MMIKKTFFMFSSLIIFGLFGCSSPEGSVASSVAAGQNSSGLSADFTDAMPVASQLAAGSVALESGANAISEDQAATLLPLWQAYSGLVVSGGTAQAELDALLNQIFGEMTEAQISEIASLQLTNAKLQEMIEAGEIQLGRGRQGGRPGGQEGQNGQPGGGGRGQGGLGGQEGGGGQGGFGNLSPDDIATRQAERIEAAGGEDSFLMQQVSTAVIRLLSTKVSGEQAREQGNGANPFQIANETVAAELGITVEGLQASATEISIQTVIEEAGGDINEISEKLREELAEAPPAQNGNLDQFLEAYFASSGAGRGRGGGNSTP